MSVILCYKDRSTIMMQWCWALQFKLFSMASIKKFNFEIPVSRFSCFKFYNCIKFELDKIQIFTASQLQNIIEIFWHHTWLQLLRVHFLHCSISLLHFQKKPGFVCSMMHFLQFVLTALYPWMLTPATS